jgi:hypothetical protein
MPGFYSLDSSLSKELHFTEQRDFQFCWEWINTLNHMKRGAFLHPLVFPPNADASTDRVHHLRAMEFPLKFYRQAQT